MRLCVIDAGRMGCLYGGLLARAGLEFYEGPLDCERFEAEAKAGPTAGARTEPA